MTAARRRRILFTDDDPHFCTLIREFLSPRYDVVTAESGYAALGLLGGARFDAVIADVNMPGMSGPEMLVEARRIAPDAKTILITSHNIDDYMALAKRYRFSTIMAKSVPFSFNEFETVINAVVTGKVFGLRRYLLNGGTLLGTYDIRSSAEAHDVREAIVSLFLRSVGVAGDMKLLLDEAITNAVYHAPRTATGRRKYREFSEVHLQPQEYVRVECGRDEEKYGVAVVDRQGALRKETVLERIERHVAGRGLLDESGRGIHMSRLFSDFMVINIRPGVKTEVILMNYINGGHRGFKPLYINELPAGAGGGAEGFQ